ncbi:MAG: hypothetical protein ABI444_03705 [Candidatus Kapaibacterium sp.]|jgi:hypothetical protein
MNKKTKKVAKKHKKAVERAKNKVRVSKAAAKSVRPKRTPAPKKAIAAPVVA